MILNKHYDEYFFLHRYDLILYEIDPEITRRMVTIEGEKYIPAGEFQYYVTKHYATQTVDDQYLTRAGLEEIERYLKHKLIHELATHLYNRLETE